jgi:ATP-dependent helicase HrpA
VAVRTFASAAEQHDAMWAGTRRLLLLGAGSPAADVQRRLRNDTKLALASAPFATVAEVVDDVVAAALDEVLADAGGPAWDEVGFAALQADVRKRLVPRAVEVAVGAGRVLAAARDVERRLSSLTAAALQPAATDISVQVARLVHPGFVSAAGTARLADVERYLAAVSVRLDKLARDPHRDRRLMQQVEGVEAAYERVRSGGGPEAADVRWLIEELRVGLWAQTLGTAVPVSEARVRREIDRLAAGQG